MALAPTASTIMYINAIETRGKPVIMGTGAPVPSVDCLSVDAIAASYLFTVTYQISATGSGLETTPNRRYRRRNAVRSFGLDSGQSPVKKAVTRGI